MLRIKTVDNNFAQRFIIWTTNIFNQISNINILSAENSDEDFQLELTARVEARYLFTQVFACFFSAERLEEAHSEQ